MKAFKYAVLGLIGVIGMLVSMFGPVRIPFVESVAKTYYRYALGALLVILLLITTVLGLFILAFDANNFKSEIKQFVKDHTQRELVLDGDIKVTFFPKLGLDTGRMSLTQRNSAKVFASVENARLYIAWWPLIKRQLVIDHVVIDGIHANFVRLKDGFTNFDDLLISDEVLVPLKFDIDSVRITDSSINWQDDLESQRVALHGLQLETGRLADTAPSNFTASFKLDSEKARLDTMVRLKSRLFFDRQAGHYEFANFEGRLEGKANQFENLSTDFSGSIDFYPAKGLITAEDLTASSTGRHGLRDITAKLVIPSLKLSNSVYAGYQLAFDANFSRPSELLSLTMRMPSFEIASRIFNSVEINADFDLIRDGNALRGKLTSPLSVNLDKVSKQLKLDTFSLTLAANSPILSGEVISSATGSLLLDNAAQNAQLAFKAKIDDSEIIGNAVINDFTHPVYTVEVSAKKLDLDRYLSSQWLEHLSDDATKLNTAGFKNMALNGKLSVGEIKINNFNVKKLDADIKIGQSMITVSPLTAQLFGGSSSGSISVSAQETPEILIQQNLKAVQIDQILASTSSSNRLIGKGDLALEFSTQGNSMGELQESLVGKVSVALAHGSLAGINLRSALVDGRTELGSSNLERVFPANFSETTGFSGLKANFSLKDGIASCTDFEMNSPLIRTTGEGEIELKTANLNYRLNAAVSSTINRRSARDLFELRGVTVPIRVSGPYASPSITIDFAAATGGKISALATAKAAKTADIAPIEPASSPTKIILQ